MTNTDTSLRAYYAARAREYDRVYLKPERQVDIQRLQQWLPPKFSGCRVLDVACGTGFWTQFIAPVTSSTVALDAGPQTLEIARRRISFDNVQFVIGDAYELSDDLGKFDAAFLGFWFSHIPKQRRERFLINLAGRMRADARVVILDNLYVEGSNHPITETDVEGNTYQARQLDDGSGHLVLKNFPTQSELHTLVADTAYAAVFTPFEYYWAFEYRVSTE